MKTLSIRKGAFICLAYCGLVLPDAAVQGASRVRETETSRSRTQSDVADVALKAGGALAGQVTDPQGIGLKGIEVSIHQGSRPVARVVTDDEGAFVVKNLRGGVYQIDAAQGSGLYRFWTPGTEPPSAATGATVVSKPAVVRGQAPMLLRSFPENIAIVGALGVPGYTAYRIATAGDDDDDELVPTSDPLN